MRGLTGKFVVDGQTYSSLEDMPPDVRRIYDDSTADMLRDDDVNGVPDIFEGKGSTSEFSVDYQETTPDETARKIIEAMHAEEPVGFKPSLAELGFPPESGSATVTSSGGDTLRIVLFIIALLLFIYAFVTIQG